MRERIKLSSEALHTIAMAFMLFDHMWATLFPAAEWLTCIGRLAFPIFAFMIAEGYSRTRSLRRYMLRLLIGAALSEIPFNLMYASSVLYPYHQNVLWTFLLSLALMYLIDRVRARFKGAVSMALCALLLAAGFILGYAAMLDYYGVGIMTVLVFRFFPCRGWKNLVGQLLCLYILHVSLLGGYFYEISIFGFKFELVQQGFALLSLVPIWLYSGEHGTGGKFFQYFCYGFYPVHMLLLFLVRQWVLA